MGDALFGASAILTLLAILLCIVWLILPFAIFGTKPLLRQLIAETQRSNELLTRLDAHSKSAPPAAGGNRQQPRMLDDSPVMRDR